MHPCLYSCVVREVEGVVALSQLIFVALVDLEDGILVENPRFVALPAVDILRLVDQYRLNQYGSPAKVRTPCLLRREFWSLAPEKGDAVLIIPGASDLLHTGERFAEWWGAVGRGRS